MTNNFKYSAPIAHNIVNTLFDSEVTKMSNVVRYNNRTRIKSESIAEHSFYVAYNVINLCRLLGIDDATKGLALEYAIIHDIPEIGTGDIPYDVKQGSKEICVSLQELEHKYLEDKFQHLVKSYKAYEEKGLEYSIVHLADMVSVVQYTNTELSLGNTNIRTINYEARELVRQRLENLINELTGGEK